MTASLIAIRTRQLINCASRTQKRHAKVCSVPEYLLILCQTVFGIGKHIRDMMDLAIQSNSSRQASAARSQWMLVSVPHRFGGKAEVCTKPIQITIALKDDTVISGAKADG